MKDYKIAKLMQTGAYPNGQKFDKKIETHISWIFFTDDYVYKVKKPIKFSFLDFSTKERRKYYCEKEIELNSRLSPEVYVGVSNINSYKGKISFDGKGRTIDYAVKMYRVPEENRMDTLLLKNKVTEKDVVEIAKKVQDFHSKAQKIDYGKWGRPKNLMELFNDIKTVKTTVAKHLGLENIIDFSIEKSDAFIEKNSDLISKRKKEGKVRDCHMDLHSANMFITDRPIIIDCVEFSRDFRFGDIASDVAFMSMDLEAKGKLTLKKAFYKEYLKLSKDKGLEKMFPWYLAYRANTRAKVYGLTLMQQTDKELIEEYKAKTKKYLLLTEKYCKEL